MAQRSCVRNHRDRFGVLPVGSGEEAILRAGDTFYEPSGQTISRFDATDEGVTFLAWFPLADGVEPELTMGPLPGE
ncbi:hypothetical protein C1632_04680 [Microbacterium testaceum]|nr:hypothetical protein C1632_04680 [Microbacterium testaceum]